MKVWRGIEVQDIQLENAAIDLAEEVFKMLERELLRHYPCGQMFRMRDSNPILHQTRFLVVADWKEPIQ